MRIHHLNGRKEYGDSSFVRYSWQLCSIGTMPGICIFTKHWYIYFLGDYIGELAYPEKTMQILYDLNDRYECYFIKGNNFVIY